MNHISENDIQLYVLDESFRSEEVNAHIQSCLHCMNRVRNYQIVFFEIKKQEKASFDFDLATVIVDQLPAKRKGLSTDRFIAGFLITFLVVCVSVPVILFGQHILNMFTGIPSFFIYATLLSASFILITRIVVMYRKYQRQMQLINYN